MHLSAQFSQIRQLEAQKGRLEKSVHQARRRAEGIFGQGARSPDTTGSTFRVADLSRQLHQIEDGTAIHARVARLEVELRRSEGREESLAAQVAEMTDSFDFSQTEVLLLRSELQEQARRDVRQLQAEKLSGPGRTETTPAQPRTPDLDVETILDGMRDSLRLALSPKQSKDRGQSATYRADPVNVPEVQRLEEVVRQHQIRLPIRFDKGMRSVAALDAELEELDGQFHLAEAARHASTRAQLLLREAELLNQMEALGRHQERIREQMAESRVEMRDSETEAAACQARGAHHRKLCEEATDAQRAVQRRRRSEKGKEHDSPEREPRQGG